MPASRPILLAVVGFLMAALMQTSAVVGQTVHRGGHAAPPAATPVALASPLPGAPISSGFGLRKHPILGITMMHEGVDLAAPAGTPIRSAAAGEVVEAGYDGGYGNFVRVRHNGHLETLYGHMSRIAATAGEPVAAGTVIGFVGSTGLANGPHLHFEVRRDGIPVDPLNSARTPLRPSRSGRGQFVEVVRGGRTANGTGGPKSASAGGVQVVRGGR